MLIVPVLPAIVLVLAGNASADCRIQNITYTDGRVVQRQTCCTPNGHCNTYCW
jgi:hypothetical protein